MKKLVCLILAFCCVFLLASCSEEDPDQAFFDAIDATNPTKIITIADYTPEGADTLTSTYDTTVNENGFTFEYTYKRYATLEDADNEDIVIDGNVVTESGRIYYKDGKYSTDNENWFSEAPSAVTSQLKLNISKQTLGDYEINDAKTKLTVVLDAEAAEALLGISISASSDVTVTISTNGTYLTRVSISYSTENAEVVMNTSYS